MKILIALAALLATWLTPLPANAAPATFTHPGVMLGRGQLDFIRAKVNAGEQPWKGAFDQMMAHSLAALSRTPKPRAIVECGPYSNPDNGCTDERQDALAAYTQALAWYVTEDARHAQKAIQLMDAWSGVIRDHTNSNAPLQTGWAGSAWPRAAEIIRYTYNGWPQDRINRFGTMLRNVYLPEIINGSHSNGTRNEIIGYWHGRSTFVDGLTQETCRDFVHTVYGISAISHFAETTGIQGQNLYPEIADRLRHALGFQSKYELGTAPPSWQCGGSVKRGLGPITEVGFNALHNRMGYAMSNTQALTERQRPAGTNVLFVAWETLTHAGG